MNQFQSAALAAFGTMMLIWPAWAVKGDAGRGQHVFGACVACHALEPNRNMTGPSLAELWNRKAGSLTSFPRYSPALKSSGIIWDDTSLDEWLKDPQHVVPGNTMTFPGIKDAQPRADLLAFLKEATQPGARPAQSAPQGGPMGGMPGMMGGMRGMTGGMRGMTGGMRGMMGGGAVPNLRKLDPEDRVQAVTHCRDTYRVTTTDGKTRDFWERNLRFKTDSSDEGPAKGAPALVDAGMMGDRADVIFSAPDEIGQFISPKC
jgi:cytochrome c